ncbi:hypothetical protein DFH07DRAFT_829656 [Mycena maculata]|uniref:Uncharacterized protein n=1 Tax=Mycena maculata TaxID=230809 RepID=A0AAD7IR30_9AGAR|nr:hypothetical protein DFH07DRAFT_829656 [Mycena maculata]
MSMQELEASLEKISADIALQREVLKKLENKKNTRTTPAQRLPRSNGTASPRDFVRNFRPISFSPPRTGIPQYYHATFKRLQYVDQHCTIHPAAVGCHSCRFFPSPRLRTRFGRLASTRREPSFVHVLETLAIHGSDGGYGDCPAPPILEVLHLVPNLVEFTIDVEEVYDLVYDIPESPEQLVLPALRRLMFGGQLHDVQGTGEIIKCFSLPYLQTLRLSITAFAAHDLTRFLRRSSPPIQELIIAGCGDFSDFSPGLEEFFRLVPSLAQLELWGTEGQFVGDLFYAFAESPTHILPNLRSLTIHLYSNPMRPALWTTLLTALSGRRSQLTYFKMVQQMPWALDPEPSVYGALRQLVVGGMEIYIGTEERSFVPRP